MGRGRSSEIQEQSVERGKGGDEITFSLRGLAYRVKQNFLIKNWSFAGIQNYFSKP